MSRSRSLALLVLPLGLVASCQIFLPDLLQHRRFQRVEPIRRIAVVPFYPHARLSRAAEESGISAWETTALVARFVSEALEVRDVEVIPETDVRLAFEGQGKVVPRQAPEVVAMLVHSEFGADAVLLGEVRRYREREGSDFGSMAPASIDFQVTLYSTPDATRLWTATFDQTQGPLSSDFFSASRYPAGGTRFLTVAELARFGARLVAEELPLGR